VLLINRGGFMTIYYTMIGSRKTPEDIQYLMVKFVEKACKFNYVGRSGGADGADKCLEEGVYNFIGEECDGETGTACHLMEIYLPWKDFNNRDSRSSGYYTLYQLSNRFQAENIAKELHPAWERCSQGVKKLHTRNVYQLLGRDLNTPSKFVICYAEPKYNDRRDE
jgi:hypothetical protein